jgi:hypothetical protein
MQLRHRTRLIFKLLLNDDKAGKPEGIHLVIGRRVKVLIRLRPWRLYCHRVADVDGTR